MDQVCVVDRKDDVVAVVALWWLSGVPKKEGKGTVILEKMPLALPTYVADISHDSFYVGETSFVRTSILCHHFILIRKCDISSPFWINVKISEMSRHF